MNASDEKSASNALEVGVAIHEALASGSVDASLSEELQVAQRKALADYSRYSQLIRGAESCSPSHSSASS